MIQHDTILNDQESASLLSSEHMDLIADVIGKLQDTVNLATNDFLLVAAFIKNLRDRSKLINAVNYGVEVSHIITELQYIDALKQRIDHMVFFLEEINSLKHPGHRFALEIINNHQKTCGLIFQLNFYQLKMAKADFVKSVDKIKVGLMGIKAQPDGNSLLDAEPKEMFSYFHDVLKNMHDVAHSFIHLAALFPVNSEVRSLSIIRHLLNQYTMESEREVLRWCMNYLEDNSIGELSIDESKEDQIQLF
jgi:hypothetical protein